LSPDARTARQSLKGVASRPRKDHEQVLQAEILEGNRHCPRESWRVGLLEPQSPASRSAHQKRIELVAPDKGDELFGFARLR
jgi:hypothetical protein